MIRDLTTGSPLKRILSFTFPMLIGNLFQQFYNMADSIIVGKYLGVDAFAAVGSTGSLNFLILGFALGLCGGLCIPIARCFGAGDITQLRRVAAHSIYIAAVAAVVISVLMAIFTRPVLVLLQTPENILDDATTYISIIFAGSASIIMYNLLAGFMRALGDSRTPLYFLVVACLTNIALDILFIAVFHMGVEGAAWATVLSQLLSGVLCFFAIKRNFPILHFTREDARPSKALTLELCGISIPMGLQFSITAIGSITLQSAVNSLGSAAVAAMSAGSKVMSIILMPVESAGSAIATFASQNYGARRVDRVRTGIRHTTLACAVYCIAGLFITRYFGGSLAQIFLDGSEVEIHALIMELLTINSLFYFPLSLIYIYRNALQGLGHTNAAMGAGLLEMVARVAVSMIFVGTYGFTAACYASPAAWVMADVYLLPIYAWASKKLQREMPVEAEA